MESKTVSNPSSHLMVTRPPLESGEEISRSTSFVHGVLQRRQKNARLCAERGIPGLRVSEAKPFQLAPRLVEGIVRPVFPGPGVVAEGESSLVQEESRGEERLFFLLGSFLEGRGSKFP